MKDTPQISVVILNYNGLEYLKQTIPNIIKLNYKNYEVIVVDNLSKDESLEYLKKFPEVKLITNSSNFGYSKGKNIGVKEAQGRYILLLDEDILIKDTDILQVLLEEYEKLSNKKIGFLSILLKEGEEEKTTFYGGFMRRFSPYNNKKIQISKIIGKESFIATSPDGGAIFFDKSIYTSLGGFDESQPYYIDVGDLGIRSTIMGYTNYIFCKKYFVHLGKKRKEDLYKWCWKYQYCFSGITRISIKNDTLLNLMLRLPFYMLYFILKTIKNTIKKRSARVIWAFIIGVGIFLNNFKDSLRERKQIQKNRKIKKDIFLYIKPPNLNN